jgi:hypothetical protein
MYEIFVYDHKSSYCFYDDVIDASKHPHIELGSRIFIPDLDAAYIVLGPGKWVSLGEDDGSENKPDDPAAASTSILGEAILGNMILGV